LRNPEAMTAERALLTDRSNVRRRLIRLLPVIEKAFRRYQ